MAEQSTETETPVLDDSVVAEKQLEDMDVNFDDFKDDDEDDSSEEETKPVKKTTKAQVVEDTEEEESDSDETDETTEVEADEADTEDDDSEQSDEDKQKAHNREMYEKRQQEKEARDAQVRTQVDEQQAYLDEAEDDPKELALRQLQIDAYENKVDRNTTKIQTGYERAIKDFDILRSNDPVIQAEVNDAIDEFQDRFVTIDKYGNPSTLKPGADMYSFLERKADSLAKLTGLGKKTQELSKNKEKSKTLTPPSRAPKAAKEDDDMAAFMEEAKR